MLETPISFSVVWSSSSRMSPRISFVRNVPAWCPHLCSASQRATCASVHVRRNCAYDTPVGASSETPGMSVITVAGGACCRIELERGGKDDWDDCCEVKDAVGELGDGAGPCAAEVYWSTRVAILVVVLVGVGSRVQRPGSTSDPE
jgi:hypothetical protein